MDNRRTSGLTSQQWRVRNLVFAHWITPGEAPTVAWLAGMLNIQPSAVSRHIDRIVKKGYLRRLPRRYRNIALPEKP